MKRLFLCLFSFLLEGILCVSLAHAQTVTGSITGIVTDPSGAVVPGARVVAHNLDTGVDTAATSNNTGLYRIDFLPIGHYQVTIEASGFSPATVPAFTLEILQTATFNVKLSVGNTSTTVDVSAAAPILNTENGTLGTTFTANTLANIPLNGLDFSAATLYVPGSVSTAGTAGATNIERNNYYTDIPNMNGNRAQSNNYTLDGIDMNETFNNLIAYSPAPEALQEMKVITSNSPADYGNVNGGGIVSVLKSGTNRFHGSAYGYVQDYRMNANSWFNNHQDPKIKINPYSQAQFGGTLGGPIKRDKLFFFVDYLGSRWHRGGTSTASVFTQAMRSGDFSAVRSVQLYDSQNGFAPFPNNQGLPIANPVARYLFAHPELYPLPNSTPSNGIASNNFQGHSRSYKANNQGDIKIEYHPTGRDLVTGFYSMSTAYDGSTSPLAITFPGVNLFPTKIIGSNWVHTFSPTLVNSARVGFTRVVWNQGIPSDPSGLFGLTGNAKVGIPFGTQPYVGFSDQSIGNGIDGVGTPGYNFGLIDNTYSYIDNLSWQRGLHMLSMGIQAIRYQNNYPTSNNYGFLGILSYNGKFTSNPAVNDAVGYQGADFVLDRVSSAQATLGSVNVGQRQWRIAGFVQDDFKMLPNLTLNFGIRYEVDQPWIEVNNKTGNVDIATGQVIYADHIPTGAPAGSGLCKNRGCYNWNFHQIMPRVGFAYQANNRLVVRGGYGATSFFEGNSSNQRLTSITPFIQAVNINAVVPSVNTNRDNTCQNPPCPVAGSPRKVEQGFSSSVSSVTYGGTFNIYPKNIQPAYVQEWSLTAEYAITHTLSLQVGYVGEQGQHIEDYGNINQYRVAGDQTSAPYYNNQYLGINSPLGVGGDPLLVTESRAMMNFNAMEATLRQRLNHGLEFTLNYTYGKAMTNSLGNYSLNVNGYNGAFQNYYDSSADYGPAGYDVRHNISWTGVYALPVGQGKEYFANANRLVDEALGGWKLAVAGVSYSGFPQTVYGPANNFNSYGTIRANQYRKLKITHRSIDHWFGTDASAIPCTAAGEKNGVCAFGSPDSSSFGTSRNGAVRGPGFLNVDLSAYKDFHIVETHTLGFRFDAFNAFNIASYGNPDTNITDVNDTGTNFGNITSQSSPTRSTERHLQFSLRYTF